MLAAILDHHHNQRDFSKDDLICPTVESVSYLLNPAASRTTLLTPTIARSTLLTPSATRTTLLSPAISRTTLLSPSIDLQEDNC